jgi:hypothetical protein
VLEAAGEWSRWLQSEADSAAALNELVDKANLKPGSIFCRRERATRETGLSLQYWEPCGAKLDKTSPSKAV